MGKTDEERSGESGGPKVGMGRRKEHEEQRKQRRCKVGEWCRVCERLSQAFEKASEGGCRWGLGHRASWRNLAFFILL